MLQTLDKRINVNSQSISAAEITLTDMDLENIETQQTLTDMDLRITELEAM